jgi:thiamine-phosphate pyrophosphorylase
MPRLGGLYVIIDPTACQGRDPVEVARAAVQGGASMIQWRDKDRDKGLQFSDARQIFDVCLRNNVYFIANDDADLALVIAATFGPIPGAGRSASRSVSSHIGVHLGQYDLPVAGVRKVMPAAFIIGASTNNVAEARNAEAEGADYIAVGDLFGTGSKSGTRSASPERLSEVKRAVTKPVIGIGGINARNAHEVIAAGADGLAVISAVCAADDPQEAAARLAALMP